MRDEAHSPSLLQGLKRVCAKLIESLEHSVSKVHLGAQVDFGDVKPD
jgi:hypothetical protein